jgi:hypothetical protein
MLSKKIISLLALFLLFYFVLHIPGLPTDEINPDGVNWHYRSQQFFVGLKSIPSGGAQIDKTYPHYHPGVTLAWIAGTGIELVKQLYPEQSVYNNLNFFTYHLVAKLFVISANAVLAVFIIYLLGQLIGFLKAFLVVGLLFLEPFFLGNSRLLHMDILLTLFLFAALLLTYLAVTRFRWYLISAAGIFMGLAFLTKSVSIGGLLFALFVGGFLVLYKHGFRKFVIYKSILIVSFFVTVVVLFPALWAAPIETLVDIFKEGERVGVRKGHEQIFFGVLTNDPGMWFYPIVLLLKMSPFAVVGVVFYSFDKFFRPQFLANAARYLRNIAERIYSSPILFLAIFYIGYFLVMTYPTKKLDRYMLPVFPFLVLIAVLGYFNAYERVKNTFNHNLYLLAVSVMFFFFLIQPLFALYPYYFTYTSPIFGTPANANTIVGQKPFGIGIPAVRNHIFENYSEAFGDYPRVGFYDTKPMGAIYMNSRLFDIRISGAGNYDLVVLAINEELPEQLTAHEEFIFEKDSSIFINGLEYWRVYVKRER